MKRFLSILLIHIVIHTAHGQNLGKLTVDKIMRDPLWIGAPPTNLQWSADSKTLYFQWNPELNSKSSWYYITTQNLKPQKLSTDDEVNLPNSNGFLNKNRKSKLYDKNGDIFLLDIASGKTKQITYTTERENNIQFNKTETGVIYQRGDNLYEQSFLGGELRQLTNFTRARKKQESKLNPQDQWLKNQQLQLFDIIQKKDSIAHQNKVDAKLREPKRPKEILIDDAFLSGLQISADQKFISYRLIKRTDDKIADVPNYLDASGYTTNISTRTKVGSSIATTQAYIYDVERDTIINIKTNKLPGIKDFPDYLKEYPSQLADRQKKNEDRAVNIGSPIFNPAGNKAVVGITSNDNKDRWIMLIDLKTGELSEVDRQRDEAWIAGPGISGNGQINWLDDDRIYFQSEASGYSHIYIADVVKQTKKQLTAGNWEVQSLQLSNDKQHFYFTANKLHPGIKHFYKMSVRGGEINQLTNSKGGNVVILSPDEQFMANLFSYSNKPPELYLQPNRLNSKAVKITQSTSKEFESYPWRDPQLITFKNRHGSTVYARLYQPTTAKANKPAVIFVHGAGYLQNVHYWWSTYFREYFFHNLLADEGYTVLDIDYTGSAGYGRDFRTGIYRHMGGRDLTDQVDGAQELIDKYGVNPKNIGIYGGSYGGFITLMGMFTQPKTFAAGAALRSVTDWAHYNHGYTSNILNEPTTDSLAYQRSSPINFANGLQGHLLMCHGMLDLNVHFQDIVRLSQRLIELHKNNWELAVYPIEDHGFEEPSSWRDEYSRIFKLFEERLNN